jgi:hypothetical protein
MIIKNDNIPYLSTILSTTVLPLAAEGVVCKKIMRPVIAVLIKMITFATRFALVSGGLI